MNTQSQLKPGTYVTDTSASGRYDTTIYRVIEHYSDRTAVALVGTVRGGRIHTTRGREITHRTTANLKEFAF